MPEGAPPHRPASSYVSAPGKDGTAISSVARLVAAARQVLNEAPAALISDIDGTISRIVARPQDATVSDVARNSLESLANQLAVVAVVTGRDAATARQMVGAKGITYVGNYGLDSEGFEPGLIASAEAEARHRLAETPCVQIESKGVSFAAHYRNCAEPETARLLILEELVPIAARYRGRVIEGKMVVELIPGSLPDKASAVLNLGLRNGLKGIVYLGDDIGDIPVFEAIRRRRAEGLPGLALAVIDAETDPSVTAAADETIAGVALTEAFLAELASIQ
jgi:trehalose 6-phosphate phosphatase